MQRIIEFSANYPEIAKTFTTVSRWVFVLLALYILVLSIKSLLSTRPTPEVWGYFLVEDGANFPITHWENVIGRAKSSDLMIPIKTMSNSHAILSRRRNDGAWILKDLGSKNGTAVNGYKIKEDKRYLISPGDEIVMGGVHCTIAPASIEESNNNKEMRLMDKEPIAPWKILVAITAFQLLSIIQLSISMKDKLVPMAWISMLVLCAVMWIYVMFFKSMGRKGFEMDMIAFFMTTLNLAIMASFNPADVFKQLLAALLGIGIMIFMCIYLRDLDRTRNIRFMLILLSGLLFAINIVFGTTKYGSTNWVTIGSMSIQPSEIIKIAFILIGAGTLDELYNKKNTYMYAGFSLFCVACLALMGDFGTALIFFATFLVVSFLRSGDFSRMVLTVVGAGIMGLMVLRFKPYIASRFAVWGHAWEYADAGGYQQTRTMSFGAGGGLLGLGAGEGSLKTLAASNTDLVFGFIMEEWGFIIALLLVICIIVLCLFAVISIVAGRSTFYTIAACSAATMFLVQTILNVFGALDLFPLTGVTFPFVSSGGTSTLASWAMLAYFKASDMRENASLAVKKED